jgi:hypothetical protein
MVWRTGGGLHRAHVRSVRSSYMTRYYGDLCHDCYYNLSGIVLDHGTKADRCKKFEDSAVRFESPFNVTVMRLIDLLVAAESTPLGDQDILYLKGFSAATGSGSPPHRDTSSVTLPPLP